MPRGRHSLAPISISPRRIALVTAPLVTALAVGVGVTSGFGAPDAPTAATNSVSSAADAPTASRVAARSRALGTSRSTERVPLVNNRVPKAKGKLWTTAPLKLRVQPREKSKVSGLVKPTKRVAVTGRRLDGFAEVLVGKQTRWVTAEYLSKQKPKPPAPAAGGGSSASSTPTGLSSAPCPDGSSIESALQPAAVKVYRAACAAFPELTTYGGQDGHGEHVNGQAIDFMVTSSATGERLKDFLYAHHAELDLFDIIWNHTIWTIERSGEGFRGMEDRGSPTANHEDHVHIMVN